MRALEAIQLARKGHIHLNLVEEENTDERGLSTQLCS